MTSWVPSLDSSLGKILYNPFGHPAAFLWTAAGGGHRRVVHLPAGPAGIPLRPGADLPPEHPTSPDLRHRHRPLAVLPCPCTPCTEGRPLLSFPSTNPSQNKNDAAPRAPSGRSIFFIGAKVWTRSFAGAQDDKTRGLPGGQNARAVRRTKCGGLPGRTKCEGRQEGKNAGTVRRAKCGDRQEGKMRGPSGGAKCGGPSGGQNAGTVRRAKCGGAANATPPFLRSGPASRPSDRNLLTRAEKMGYCHRDQILPPPLLPGRPRGDNHAHIQ